MPDPERQQARRDARRAAGIAHEWPTAHADSLRLRAVPRCHKLSPRGSAGPLVGAIKGGIRRTEFLGR